MRTIDVKHDGMGRFRRITGFGVVEQKAAAQQQFWDKQWQCRQALERKLSGDALQALKKLRADEKSEEANREIVALASILLDALRARPTVEWEQFYDRSAFAELPPNAPAPLQLAKEPRKQDFKPPPPRNLLELLNRSRRRELKETGTQNFKNAHDEWNFTVGYRSRQHDAAAEAYRAQLAAWDTRKSAFHATQTEAKTRLDSLHLAYAAKDPEAVIAYGDLILLAADRPDGFPKHWQIGFSAGAMTVDYDLPSTDVIPSVKAVKYAAARDAFETVELGEGERDRLYAEAMYQSCLAVLHLLFASDGADAIKSITFNGWVNFIDGSRPARACIMTVHTTKQAFAQIDLKSVDPRACFKALNGVASSKLAQMSAPGD
jgi:restriction system protein